MQYDVGLMCSRGISIEGRAAATWGCLPDEFQRAGVVVPTPPFFSLPPSLPPRFLLFSRPDTYPGGGKGEEWRAGSSPAFSIRFDMGRRKPYMARVILMHLRQS